MEIRLLAKHPAALFCLDSGAPYSELQMVDQGTPPLMSKRQTFLMNFTQFGLNFMVLLLSVVGECCVAHYLSLSSFLLIFT